MVRSADKNRSADFARAWLGAFGFLTVLPSPTWRDGDAPRLILGFPWVGLALGLGLWTAWPWLDRLPSGLGGVAVAALWLSLTGFLHFDGLCDCADAALAAQPPERRRQIARDTRLGSYALAVGGLYLIGLVAVLDATTDARALLVAPFVARTAVVVPLWLGKPDADSRFAAALRPTTSIVLATLAGALLAGGIVHWLATGLSGYVWLRIACVAGLTTLVTCGWLQRRFGAMTGDILGASVCTVELSVVAAWPWIAT